MTFAEIGIEEKSSQTRYAVRCPKCSHDRKKEHQRSACLTVNNEPNNRWWNCNHCGWSGNLEIYDKFSKVWEKSRMPREQPAFYHKEIIEWLESKGIDQETAKLCRVFQVKGLNGHMEVAYPYYENGTLVNVMYRKMVYDKEKGEGREYQMRKEDGTKTVFWGLGEIKYDVPHIIITEGQTDRMTWVKCGYDNIISVPMGAPSPNTKKLDKKLEYLDPVFFGILKRWYNGFSGVVPKIIIATDSDAPGLFLKELLCDAIGKTKCWYVIYPPGYKDANEVYVGDVKKNLDPKGKKGIDNLYKFARPYPIAGIIKLNDIREKTIHYGLNGIKEGYKTGRKHYDSLFTIKEKIMVVHTGIPSHGKSLITRDYLVALCTENPGMRWALFSPEMRPPEREYIKLAENYIGLKMDTRFKNHMSEKQRDIALDWVNERFTLINPHRLGFEKFGQVNEEPGSMNNLFNYFKQLKQQEGIFGFVIDAWNRIEHMKPKGDAEEQFIGRELNRILDFLNANDLATIIVAHPTKMEEIQGGNFKMPTMYSIKGSSAWYERIDIGLCSHRKDLYINLNKGIKGADPNWVKDVSAATELHVQKMKFEELQGNKTKQNLYLDWRAGERMTLERPYYSSDQKSFIKEEEEVEVEEVTPF